MMSPLHRRIRFAQDLSPLYLPYYEALCELLPSIWQPYQGFRTFKQQHELYLMGRRGVKLERTVTDADGGESAHNYGCATDWTLWDEDRRPIWIDVNDSRWDEYVQAVEKVGLRSGREFRRNDVGHNELKISSRWKTHVKPVYEEFGMDRAQEFIKNAMIV